MTEAEWLASTHTEPMVNFSGGRKFPAVSDVRTKRPTDFHTRHHICPPARADSRKAIYPILPAGIRAIRNEKRSRRASEDGEDCAPT